MSTESDIGSAALREPVVTDRVAAAEVDNPKWEQTPAQTVARFTR
jgi:hypothetical protein